MFLKEYVIGVAFAYRILCVIALSLGFIAQLVIYVLLTGSIDKSLKLTEEQEQQRNKITRCLTIIMIIAILGIIFTPSEEALRVLRF